MVTILIVDDIEGIHEMMDMVFFDTNYSLKHARAADEAIQMYKEQPTDVVVSDIQMPGLDGLELFEELRKIDPDIVCIMMTAANSKDYVIKALRLGAFDYVEKPFAEEVFVETINRGIEERRRRHIAQKQSGRGAHPSAADGAVNQAEVERLKQELQERDLKLQAQEAKERELTQRQNELELKQSALETMDTVLKERLKNVQNIQQGDAGEGLSPKAREELQQLKAELECKEQELQESELNMQERELFLQTSEESLFEKGQKLTEMEAELEQLREELESRKSSIAGAGGGPLSAEDQAEMDKLKTALEEKQGEMEKQERQLAKREFAVKKAEMLVKAREQFLEQSEDILFRGQEQKQSSE